MLGPPRDVFEGEPERLERAPRVLASTARNRGRRVGREAARMPQ